MKISSVIVCVVSITSAGIAVGMDLGEQFNKENQGVTATQPLKRERDMDNLPVAKFKSGESRRALVDVGNIVAGSRVKRPNSVFAQSDGIDGMPVKAKKTTVNVGRKKLNAKKPMGIKKEKQEEPVSPANVSVSNFYTSPAEYSLVYSSASSAGYLSDENSPFKNALFNDALSSCAADLSGLGLNLEGEDAVRGAFVAESTEAAVGSPVAKAAVGSPIVAIYDTTPTTRKLMSSEVYSSGSSFGGSALKQMQSPGQVAWDGSPWTPYSLLSASPLSASPLSAEIVGRLVEFYGNNK